MWTKEEMKYIVKVWDEATLDDICDKFEVSKSQIMYIVTQLRKNGIKLAKKHVTGRLQALIDEVKRDLKIR